MQIYALIPIEELNRLPAELLGSALQPLFEAAGPLANALAAERPYVSYEQLISRAAEIVAALPEAERIDVVDAHPRIGAPPESLREAAPISFREQGYDREPERDEAELERPLERLAGLNEAYEARFGFRFVVFVDRRPRAALIPVIEERLGNPREQELATGLSEMLAIARDRLHGLRRTPT